MFNSFLHTSRYGHWYFTFRNIWTATVFACVSLLAANINADDYSKHGADKLMSLSEQGDLGAKIEIGDRILLKKLKSKQTALYWYCEAADTDWEYLLQYVKNDFSERDNLIYFAVSRAASYVANAISYGLMMANLSLEAKDLEGAYGWFGYAKNFGSLEAANNQGCLALSQNDRRTAIELFRSAAIGGLSGAMYNLGLEAYKYYLAQPTKVRSDLFFAKYWLEQAAMRDEEQAKALLRQINIEELILKEINGESSTPPDPKRLSDIAYDLLAKGVKRQRDAARQIRYYLMICKKLGQEPDPELLFRYGLFCQKGLSIAKHNVKAIKIIAKAAKREHYEARREYGRILLTDAHYKNEVQEGLHTLRSLGDVDKSVDKIFAEAYIKKAFKLDDLKNRTRNGLELLCNEDKQRACLELFRWNLEGRFIDQNVDEAFAISKKITGKEKQIAVYELAKYYSEKEDHKLAILQWELLESLCVKGSNLGIESRQRLAEYFVLGMYDNLELFRAADLFQAHSGKGFFIKSLNVFDFTNACKNIASMLIELEPKNTADKKSNHTVARKILENCINLGDAEARALMFRSWHETDVQKAQAYLAEIIPPHEAKQALTLFLENKLQPDSFPSDLAPLALAAVDLLGNTPGYLCLAAGAGSYAMAKALATVTFNGAFGFKKNRDLASSWILRVLTQEDVDSFYNKGMAYQWQKNTNEAVNFYLKAAKLKHKEAQARLYGIALSFHQGGNYERAQQVLRMIIDLDLHQDDEIIRKAKLILGLMQVNNIGMKNPDIEEGIKLLDEAQEVSGWNALANYYFTTKEYDKSISYCDLVLQCPQVNKSDAEQVKNIKDYSRLFGTFSSEDNSKKTAKLLEEIKNRSSVAK